MPDKIILNQQNEVNNYIFNDLRLPLSNPQKKHLELLVSGMIGCSDKRTVSNIVRSSFFQMDRSCTQKFLNSPPWDENLVNLKRKQYTAKALEKELKASNEPLFVILDDTINKKSKDSKHIAGMGFNYSHTSGKQEWSHNVQGLHCVTGNLSIPFDFELYLKKDDCTQRQEEFSGYLHKFVGTTGFAENLSSILLDRFMVYIPQTHQCSCKTWIPNHRSIEVQQDFLSGRHPAKTKRIREVHY